mmetsp:Transcript_29414/g.89008  ORF Transcript_29414/g.89008 Transcript_29414/m.89008 type:complete len:228 (-) Transcript_29414:878-1561(-)
MGPRRPHTRALVKMRCSNSLCTSGRWSLNGAVSSAQSARIVFAPLDKMLVAALPAMRPERKPMKPPAHSAKLLKDQPTRAPAPMPTRLQSKAPKKATESMKRSCTMYLTLAQVSMLLVMLADSRKLVPRIAHCTYAHSLKYCKISPMHSTMHFNMVRMTQHAMFRLFSASVAARSTTAWTARTSATRNEPKQTLPKDVVHATPRLLLTAACSSTPWYQRPTTPQYVR